LVYHSILLFPNSYTILFWEFYFLTFSVHAMKNNAPEKYRCPHTWLHSLAWWHVRKKGIALHSWMCTSASVFIVWNRAILGTSLSARYCNLFEMRGWWMNEQMGCREEQISVEVCRSLQCPPIHILFYSILSE
jgi:hypothetical protein